MFSVSDGCQKRVSVLGSFNASSHGVRGDIRNRKLRVALGRLQHILMRRVTLQQLIGDLEGRTNERAFKRLLRGAMMAHTRPSYSHMHLLWPQWRAMAYVLYLTRVRAAAFGSMW